MPESASPPRPPRSAHELPVLIELYKEHCAHGRHIESQRSAVASMFLTATGILLSVIGALEFGPGSLPLAASVIGLAYFAKKFVATYAAKWDETGQRRRHYRAQMEQISGAAQGPPASSGGTLRRHWERTFDIVLAIGLVVTLIIVAKAISTYRATDCQAAGVLLASSPTAGLRVSRPTGLPAGAAA